MKSLVLFLGILFIAGICLADTKIYYDDTQGKEVQDISGVIPVEQINYQFKGNFKDITVQKKEKVKQDIKNAESLPKNDLSGRVDDLEKRIEKLEKK